MMKKLNLSGLTAAIPTPFKGDQICFKSLKKNLEFYEKTPLKGYVVSGTNGEAPSLTPAERVEIAKFVRENTDGSKLVIGGATAECTKNACELAVEMGKAGVDGVMVMPPFYFRRFMTDSALIEHFKLVADISPVPVVIYNNPGVTGIDIGIPVLSELAKHHNIAGVKDIEVKKCRAILSETKECDFQVVNATAGSLLSSLMMGCVGGMTGLSSLLPDETSRIYELYENGQLREANLLQMRIAEADHKILVEMGVRGLKGAMDLKGLIGGPCRKPIPPLNSEEIKKIKKALESTGFL